VLALRSYPRRGRFDNLQQFTVVMLTVMARASEANALARKSAGDEDRLARSNDPLSFMRQSGNAVDLILPRH
jgi:hypothetical protein